MLPKHSSKKAQAHSAEVIRGEFQLLGHIVLSPPLTTRADSPGEPTAALTIDHGIRLAAHRDII